MKTRIQLHLQNFVLDFLLMVPQIEAEPVKMANVNAHERWKWWCQYHCWDRRRPQFEDRHPRTPAGTTPERIAAQRPASSGAMTRVTTAPALPTGFSDSEEDRSGKMGDQSDGETQARYDVHQKMLARAKYRAGKIHNILPFLSQKPQSSETERDATISWKGALACEKQREAENRRKTSQLLFAPSGGSPCNLGFRGFKSRRRPSTATCEKAAKPTPKHIFPWFANDPKFHQRWTAHNALDPKTAQRFPLSSSKHHKPTHGSFKSTPSRRASSVGHPRQSSASNQLRTKIDIEENAYAMGSKTAAPHFKRAKELHIVPSYAPTHPEYAYYQMRDADLDAACHIAVSSDTIDVSYNRITRLEPLLQIPWIGECRILKLVGLKLAGESPFTQMSVKCPKLHTLSLAQTPLPQHWIHELTMALKRGWHRSLSYFNVAGTGLGRNGQHDCVKLFETLRLCNSLLELDISDNVLKEAGFRVIKDLIDEESRLRNLFMSDNGGSVGVDTGMNIVFEGISTNLSLQVLDISNSNLRFSDVFVLETMMMSHQGILDNILMASNPLGVRGMVCVLRMTTEGHVSMVDVANFRDCEYQDISFRAENPSGNYDLDMALVLDRVQLIRLLLWSDKWNMPHEGLFRDLKYEGKACELSHLCGRGKYNGYDVHVQTGRVRFIFTGHIPLRGKTNTDMLRNWHESRRHKMSMASFAVLANLYLGLRTEQEMDVLLRAASSALLLKISHLRFLIEQSPIFMRAHVVITVYPALDFMDRLTGVDVLSSVMTMDKNSCLSFKAAEECDSKTRSSTQFNASNPTGRYELDLTLPPDYALLERILVINMFEKQIAAKLGRTDCSRNGNCDAIRNFIIDTGSLEEVTEDFAVWEVPPFGVGSFVRFDYVSPQRPQMSLATTQKSVFSRILKVMKSSDLPDIEKVNCLRSISNTLVCDVPMVRCVLSLFPRRPTRSWTRKTRGRSSLQTIDINDSAVRHEIPEQLPENTTPSPAKLLPTAAPTALSPKLRPSIAPETETLKETLAYEGGIAKVARIEATILLFNRVADRIGMCCPGGCIFDNCRWCQSEGRSQGLLYSCQYFSRKDIKELVMRLGVLNCFDALHCCQRVPSNVGCEWKNDIVRNRVQCNLAVYEDRRLCAFIIRLALKEEGESMKDVAYSATRSGSLGAGFVIPSFWITDLPNFGIVQITYASTRAAYCLLDKRHEFAMEYFSWEDFR
eukprot:GEMP01002653.1.p1 GENE.GEMP01002653.1~~GEMP01002653.1.p1  ORF type:complete len:1216 (+),score=211.62 GEMP01002653.1:900-4547(+)